MGLACERLFFVGGRRHSARRPEPCSSSAPSHLRPPSSSSDAWRPVAPLPLCQRARIARAAAPVSLMAPSRRSRLRAGVCAALLATASGLRLPSYVTEAAATLLAAVGSERKADGAAAAAAGAPARPASYPSELVDMPGHTRPELVKSALPPTYVTQQQMPAQFSWGDVNGVSFLTRALNQHVPQCASPRAHAAFSPRCDAWRGSRPRERLTAVFGARRRLRLLLGARHRQRAGGPHQDCPWRPRRGRRRVYPVAAQLRRGRRGVVPRRLDRRRLRLHRAQRLHPLRHLPGV